LKIVERRACELRKKIEGASITECNKRETQSSMKVSKLQMKRRKNIKPK
jgi:hypothetical protein